jgi:hypothetical protein
METLTAAPSLRVDGLFPIARELCAAQESYLPRHALKAKRFCGSALKAGARREGRPHKQAGVIPGICSCRDAPS